MAGNGARTMDSKFAEEKGKKKERKGEVDYGSSSTHGPKTGRDKTG